MQNDNVILMFKTTKCADNIRKAVAITYTGAQLGIFCGKGGFQKIGKNFEQYKVCQLKWIFINECAKGNSSIKVLRYICFVYKNI